MRTEFEAGSSIRINLGSESSQLRFSEDMNRDICDYLAVIVGS